MLENIIFSIISEANKIFNGFHYSSLIGVVQHSAFYFFDTCLSTDVCEKCRVFNQLKKKWWEQ